MAQSLVAQPLGFPAVWLRHNCPCPDCRDPVTGQRLVEITQVSNVSVATVTAECGDSLEVTFTPGGHRSVFSRAWLAALLIDGFAAAAALRAADPVSFGVLTATPIPFSYVDKATSLTACQPLIALSADGRIACIRLNNRSLQPLRLPFGQAEAVYAATDRDNSKKQFASPCDRVSASRRLGATARSWIVAYTPVYTTIHDLSFAASYSR